MARRPIALGLLVLLLAGLIAWLALLVSDGRSGEAGGASLAAEHERSPRTDAAPPAALAQPQPAPAPEKTQESEAIVWYLHHSGWVVKTSDHLLIFDPVEPAGRTLEKGEEAPKKSLDAGCVDLDEIKTQDVFVFITHDHVDHFQRAVFAWKESLPRSHFICGFRHDDFPDHVTTLRAHEEREFDQVKVSTISSTDEGVGFLVQVDGLTIFHAGDHADWSMGDHDQYVGEIRRVAGGAESLDLMFFPVATGMGQRDPSITYGAVWAICELKPRAAFPMHSGGKEENHSLFVERFGQGSFEGIPHAINAALKPVPDTKLCAAKQPGHRFRYAGGQIK